MGIDLAHNTRALFGGPLTIEDRGLAIGDITWGPRVGITKGVERAWRCWVEGNRAVSGRK
jgi:3-methyladenine DNA glycosylase Mpg